MNDNVVEFPKPELTVIVEPEFDYDALFESLQGHEYETVLVLTITKKDGFEWFGPLNVAEASYFMDQAKARIMEELP